MIHMAAIKEMVFYHVVPIKYFTTANDLETARYVSDLCGEKTIQTTSTSKKSHINMRSRPKAQALEEGL